MERIRRGWTALRENRRSGLSMLVALCACALLLSLTLRLIYAATVHMARANRKIVQERCRLLTDTFSGTLDAELRKYTAGEDRDGWEEPVWDDAANLTAETGTFYNHVNAFLENSAYAGYDPGDPSTVVSFKQDGGSRDNPYGELEIRLRKTDLTDSATGNRKAFREDITAVRDATFNSYGSFDYGSAEQGTRTAERDNKFIRYQVQVDVASALGEEFFLRSAEYYREDCYQPCYTWHVTNLDSRPEDFARYRPVEGTQTSPIDNVPVFWDPVGRKFFRDREKTAVIEPSVWYWDEPVSGEEFDTVNYDRHTWIEEVAVSYVYYDGNGDFHATCKHFVPAYEKDRADRMEEGGEDAS